MMTPSVIVTNMPKKPTKSETRAPYSSRTICDRPRLSAPIQNAGSSRAGLR